MHRFPGIKAEHIAKNHKIGGASLRNAYKELKDAGYIEFKVLEGYTVVNKLEIPGAKTEPDIKPLPKTIKRVKGGSEKKRIEAALVFYDDEIENSNSKPHHNAYCDFVTYLDGNNPLEKKLDHILLVPDQLKYEKFELILVKAKTLDRSIKKMMDSMANTKSYTKGKESLYLTLNNWLNRD